MVSSAEQLRGAKHRYHLDLSRKGKTMEGRLEAQPFSQGDSSGAVAVALFNSIKEVIHAEKE